MLVASTYYWHSQGWSTDNLDLHEWVVQQVNHFDLPFVLDGDRNMTPTLYEKSRVNDKIGARTLALAEGGAYRYKQRYWASQVDQYRSLHRFRSPCRCRLPSLGRRQSRNPQTWTAAV